MGCLFTLFLQSTCAVPPWYRANGGVVVYRTLRREILQLCTVASPSAMVAHAAVIVGLWLSTAVPAPTNGRRAAPDRCGSREFSWWGGQMHM